MSVETKALAGQDHGHDDAAAYHSRVVKNRLGLWLFLASDAFLFGGLLVARAVLWGDTRPHLNQTLGLLVTTMLLASSFFMNRAEIAAAFGNAKEFKRSLAITLALGVAFLVGVVFIEWPLAASEGVTTDTIYGAVFYTMTGMHAFHVLTGVIFLALVMRNGLRGMYTPERHFQVEAAAIYWHFVDVAWIFFYPALYLIGSLK